MVLPKKRKNNNKGMLAPKALAHAKEHRHLWAR